MEFYELIKPDARRYRTKPGYLFKNLLTGYTGTTLTLGINGSLNNYEVILDENDQNIWKIGKHYYEQDICHIFGEEYICIKEHVSDETINVENIQYWIKK